jgi:hypothetical protein
VILPEASSLLHAIGDRVLALDLGALLDDLSPSLNASPFGCVRW